MMKTYTSLLQESGLRLTPIRKAILSTFQKQNAPLTVPKLQAELEKQKILPNKTTLYRQIETLLQQQVLQITQIEVGKIHYELAKYHHHHFICENCNSIKCVSDSTLEESISHLEQKLEQKGIQVRHHHFSFSGLCSLCL